MPYEQVLVRKLIRFVPDEAHSIAADLRALAEQTRELTERLRTLDSELQTDWDGQARQRFLADFGEQPPFGESTADWLESEASRIEKITVERWEEVYEQQWVPD